MRREALRAAVAAKLASGQLTVVESLAAPEGARTKALVKELAALGLTGAPALLVVRELGPVLARAARNVPWLGVVTPRHISVCQLLAAHRVVFERAGLVALEEALAR